MQFLADVELICEECKGARYKPQVLDVRYRGKNIHEVLNLTVREALHFFAGVPKVVEKLRVLEEVGLGYLRLAICICLHPRPGARASRRRRQLACASPIQGCRWIGDRRLCRRAIASAALAPPHGPRLDAIG